MTRILLLCCTALVFTHITKAQTTSDSLTTRKLNEVVISEDYQAEKYTPVSFTNLSIQSLESRNTGQEPSFILSTTPSMTVYSDAGSYQGYSYFRLRGIDQTRLNMTLDGVPLNEPEDQGVYFSNYPDFLNSVSNVQIQRGVGTTKNGNASFGGSLQFSSPQLFDSTYTSLGAGYGSFGTYRFFGEHNHRKGNKAFYIRASRLSSDGYKFRSANDSKSVFYSAGIYNDKHKLKLTGFAGNQKNQMAWLGVPLEVIEAEPRTNANAQEDDSFTQSLTQLQHEFLFSSQWTLRSSLYYNYLEGNYDFDLNNFLGLPSTDEMLNYALMSHLFGGFSNLSFESDKVNWTTGIHISDYSREHIGSERTARELYENTGYKNEYSAFTKMSLTLQKVVLFADLQYRHTNFSYEGTVPLDRTTWNFLNPKVGITYVAQDNLQFYYSVGRTGREPTRNDLFGGSDDLLANEDGSPILAIIDPEYVVDHELGLRLYSEKLSGSLNYYHMSFDNEIVLNGQFGPNGLALNSNVESSTRQGVELSLRYAPLPRLVLENNASYNRSLIKQNDESFNPILTPQFIINQGITYNLRGFETGLNLRYQGASYIDFANENEIPDYALLDWRFAYHFNGLTFSFFVNNVTDTQYFNNGFVDFDGTNKFFVQAPRNYYAMLTYRF
ncbi:MAG: TonB-dependent receptor [Bacteroidota bacterium]